MTTMQERADRLVRDEVYVCLSSLVSTLAKGAYQVGQANSNMRKGDLKELSDLCEQAFELRSPVLDYEEAARQAGWVEQENGDWTHGPVEGEVCDYEGCDPYEWEIFEHWSVSQSLADDLAALGERVDMDFAGMCVWGRTTTGQAIAMDGVIRRVLEMHDARLAKFEKEEKVA